MCSPDNAREVYGGVRVDENVASSASRKEDLAVGLCSKEGKHILQTRQKVYRDINMTLCHRGADGSSLVRLLTA